MAGKVTFIIPTYNSGRTIGKCLESVLSQKVRKHVMVIDDGSTDRTEKVMKRFINKVRYIRQENRGPASARNRGLRLAKTGHVCFVDSDVVLPDGWAEKAMGLIEKRDADAVGGPGISREKSIVSRSLNMLLYGERGDEEREVNSLATMDVMYRKDALEGMEFDESFTASSGEDPDFNFRLRKKGRKLLFSPRLWVYHDHPVGLGGIIRKWFKYGRHYPLLYSKHPRLKGKEYYARTSYFPLLIILLLLTPVSPLFAYAASLQIISLYAAYFAVGIRAGAGSLVFAFAFVHALKQLAQLFGTMIGLRKII